MATDMPERKRVVRHARKRASKRGAAGIPLPPASDWRSTDEQEVLRRVQRAIDEKPSVRAVDDRHPVFATFAVKSPSGMEYQVEVRDVASRAFSCTCPDFRAAGLGTCKHVEATLIYLKRRRRGDFRLAVNSGSPFVDLVASWTVRISDSTIASTTSFSWEAEGPIGLNPQQVATFGGLAENVWKIENPLNWRPGKYIIRCTMILSGGINAHLEFIQEIGVRSGEIIVVGWIDADAVILPDGDSAPETINNVEANSIADILNHPLRRATFMARIAFNDGFPYKMPLTPEVARQYFNAFMIKTSGNPPPPQHFRAPITGTSMEMVDYQAMVDFLSNTRNYRLANRFQVKFLVDEQGKIKDEPFCAPQWAKAGLTPVDLKPEKWFELFSDGMFDNIPAEEGEFHGLINTNGQVLNFNTAQAYSSELPSSIAQYSQARISGDGNASGGYISQQVNGRKVPWIWSEVKFEAPLAQGTVATIPNHEIFPAVWIYYNGELIEALIDPIEENDLKNFIQLGPELPD